MGQVAGRGAGRSLRPRRGSGAGRERVESGSGAGRGPWCPSQNLIQFWLRMSQARVGCGARRNPAAAFRPIIRLRPTPPHSD